MPKLSNWMKLAITPGHWHKPPHEWTGTSVPLFHIIRSFRGRYQIFLLFHFKISLLTRNHQAAQSSCPLGCCISVYDVYREKENQCKEQQRVINVLQCGISTSYLHLNQIKFGSARVNQGAATRERGSAEALEPDPNPCLTQAPTIITCAKQIFSLQP